MSVVEYPASIAKAEADVEYPVAEAPAPMAEVEVKYPASMAETEAKVDYSVAMADVAMVKAEVEVE